MTELDTMLDQEIKEFKDLIHEIYKYSDKKKKEAGKIKDNPVNVFSELIPDFEEISMDENLGNMLEGYKKKQIKFIGYLDQVQNKEDIFETILYSETINKLIGIDIDKYKGMEVDYRKQRKRELYDQRDPDYLQGMWDQYREDYESGYINNLYYIIKHTNPATDIRKLEYREFSLDKYGDTREYINNINNKNYDLGTYLDVEEARGFYDGTVQSSYHIFQETGLYEEELLAYMTLEELEELLAKTKKPDIDFNTWFKEQSRQWERERERNFKR